MKERQYWEIRLEQLISDPLKTNLSNDVLKNVLSFRGRSLELFKRAVEEVQILTNNGRVPIYPPHEYPTWKEPDRATSLQKWPDSNFTGRLTPTEAVGIKVLMEESLALFQVSHISLKVSRKINEILGTGKEVGLVDAIEAIVDFTCLLGQAAVVRETMMFKEEESIRRAKNSSGSSLYLTFEESITQDGLRLGINTAAKVVEEIIWQAEELLPTYPNYANCEDDIKVRIAGKTRGAKLASALYLETVDLAAKILSPDIIIV